MKRSIGYHTRECGTDRKITNGSFGGAIDQESVERLTTRFNTVRIKQSGSPVLVDGAGREVSLYFRIDPAETAMGKAAIEVWRKERAAEIARREAEETAERSPGVSTDTTQTTPAVDRHAAPSPGDRGGGRRARSNISV